MSKPASGQSPGAQRVRLGFNPSESPAVTRIKREGVTLIDSIDEFVVGDSRA